MGGFTLKKESNLSIFAVTAQKFVSNMLSAEVNSYIGLIKWGLQLNNIHV